MSGRIFDYLTRIYNYLKTVSSRERLNLRMNSSQKLNPSELKSQLYHSLQQKGVLDAMKVSSCPYRKSWREVQNRNELSVTLNSLCTVATAKQAG